MVGDFVGGEYDVTKGTSEWEGWGTALKPSHEPIVMARKPLSEKTGAINVLRWGTGGINIDESRIGTEQIKSVYGGFTAAKEDGRDVETRNDWIDNSKVDNKFRTETTEGRWPANIIFDEEAGQVLDQQSGISTGKIGMTQQSSPNKIYGEFKSTGDTKVNDGITDKGGASRFFYCPKASKKDRDEGMDGFEEKMSEIAQINSQTKLQPNGEYVENITLPRKNVHPTVKPTELMLYLIKLVTPKGKTVMDCFMGSGSTGKAAVKGGFDFIGIEREEEYYKIAEARINNK
jgi:site-specific DNA-methyltransferase (adenine-specific)